MDRGFVGGKSFLQGCVQPAPACDQGFRTAERPDTPAPFGSTAGVSRAGKMRCPTLEHPVCGRYLTASFRLGCSVARKWRICWESEGAATGNIATPTRNGVFPARIGATPTGNAVAPARDGVTPTRVVVIRARVGATPIRDIVVPTRIGATLARTSAILWHVVEPDFEHRRCGR